MSNTEFVATLKSPSAEKEFRIAFRTADLLTQGLIAQTANGFYVVAVIERPLKTYA